MSGDQRFAELVHAGGSAERAGLEPEKRRSFYLGPVLVSCLSAAPYKLHF